MTEDYRILDEQMNNSAAKSVEERREGLDKAMREARQVLSDKGCDGEERVALDRFLDSFETMAKDGIDTTEGFRKAMEWTYDGDKLEYLLLSLTSLAIVAQAMESCKGLSEQYNLLKKALMRDHGGELVKLGICSMHAKQALELYMTEVMNTIKDICEEADREAKDDKEDKE